MGIQTINSQRAFTPVVCGCSRAVPAPSIPAFPPPPVLHARDRLEHLPWLVNTTMCFTLSFQARPLCQQRPLYSVFLLDSSGQRCRQENFCSLSPTDSSRFSLLYLRKARVPGCPAWVSRGEAECDMAGISLFGGDPPPRVCVLKSLSVAERRTARNWVYHTRSALCKELWCEMN